MRSIGGHSLLGHQRWTSSMYGGCAGQACQSDSPAGMNGAGCAHRQNEKATTWVVWRRQFASSGRPRPIVQCTRRHSGVLIGHSHHVRRPWNLEQQMAQPTAGGDTPTGRIGWITALPPCLLTHPEARVPTKQKTGSIPVNKLRFPCKPGAESSEISRKSVRDS